MATKEAGRDNVAHRPITACSMMTTSEHWAAQAAFSSSPINRKDVRTRNAELFRDGASDLSLSPEPRHTIAVRVNSVRPTKPHATSFRRAIPTLTRSRMISFSKQRKGAFI